MVSKLLREVAVELSFDAYQERILFITKKLRLDPTYTYAEWDAEMQDMEARQEQQYRDLHPKLKLFPGSEVIEFTDDDWEEHA